MVQRGSLMSQIVSGEKIVPNAAFNRLGLQVARTVVAHALYNVQGVSTPESFKEHVRTLQQDGVLVLRDVLPDSEFAAVGREFFEAYDRYHEDLFRSSGRNLYEMAYFHRLPSEAIPNARRLAAGSTVRHLLEGGEKRAWAECFHFAGLEYITYGEDGEPDPQVTFHADAFYHTHKVWLYIEDVTLENGPLAIVKGTHRLTLRQIPHIYSHSLESGVDASRRITDREMEQVGLRETVMTCSKNTLVIANTAAYHRRTQGKPGARRYAVQVVARANPFAIRAGLIARAKGMLARRSQG